ncbi:MAG: hypothetical protein L3K18_08685 [Thermoplasmata archaeon]|nr:hypothetical protein [Thermoplasmata archaeon]
MSGMGTPARGKRIFAVAAVVVVVAIIVLSTVVFDPAAFGLSKHPPSNGVTLEQVAVVFVGNGSSGLSTNFTCSGCPELLPYGAGEEISIPIDTAEPTPCAGPYHEIEGVSGSSLGGFTVGSVAPYYSGLGGVRFPMQVPFCAEGGAQAQAEVSFLLEAENSGPAAQSETVLISVN